MNEDAPRPFEDKLVFMVAGDDGVGDHHIFVTTDKRRDEERYKATVREFTDVKANWLDQR